MVALKTDLKRLQSNNSSTRHFEQRQEIIGFASGSQTFDRRVNFGIDALDVRRSPMLHVALDSNFWGRGECIKASGGKAHIVKVTD